MLYLGLRFASTFNMRLSTTGSAVDGMKDSELYRRSPEISQMPGVRVVKSLQELNGEGGSFEGLYMGLAGDIAEVPKLMASYISGKMRELLGIGATEFEDHHEVLLVPGYAATSKHLDVIQRHLENLAISSHLFDRRSLSARVLDDAARTAEAIVRMGNPLVITGHSRGGLVTLNAMKLLQDIGQDELVKAAILLSPTSHGIRDEIAQFARILGLPAINDLCPGSEAIENWQDLSPANRAKVTVVTQAGGDAFTSPQHSHVEGGTTYVVPHCSHQAAVRDSGTTFFQVAKTLVKDTVVRPN